MAECSINLQQNLKGQSRGCRGSEDREKGTDLVEETVAEHAGGKSAVGCSDKEKHRCAARKLWQRLGKEAVVSRGRNVLFDSCGEKSVEMLMRGNRESKQQEEHSCR